jgi:hypothetical protein
MQDYAKILLLKISFSPLSGYGLLFDLFRWLQVTLKKIIEGKITRPNFFYRIQFSISRKLFALTILRVSSG